jgi:methanethiol S-methyltransferase
MYYNYPNQFRIHSLFNVIIASGIFVGLLLFNWAALQTALQFISNYYFLLAMGWVVWFAWHTWIFDKTARYIYTRSKTHSYKILYFSQVIPIVTLFSFLMGFPGIVAYKNQEKFAFDDPLHIGSLLLICLGLFIILKSFQTIGISRAAFCNDYCGHPDKLITASIYGKIRHPLYSGGLIISFGVALFINPELILFSLINLAFAPVYIELEEKRLLRIYGDTYRQYIKNTGALVPKIKFKI